eukprot:8616600-Karenia_brevis.AAC.1
MKGGQWQFVALLFNVMFSEGLGLGLIRLSAVISACGQDDKWQCVVAFFDEMGKDLLLDMISFSAAFSICIKVGQWHLVAPLFEDMFSAGLRLGLLSFSAVISSGGQDDKWQRAVWQRAVVSMYMKSWAWQCMAQLLNEMHRAALRLGVMLASTTISACITGGQWQ